MKKEIVAIYGGTFSPPHIGHVHAAEALSAAFQVPPVAVESAEHISKNALVP